MHYDPQVCGAPILRVVLTRCPRKAQALAKLVAQPIAQRLCLRLKVVADTGQKMDHNKKRVRCHGNPSAVGARRRA